MNIIALRRPSLSKISAYAVPVATRYAGMGFQLLMVVLVAHYVSIDQAGVYFALYGLMSVTYVLAGFGLPDGMVLKLSSVSVKLVPARTIGLVQRAFVVTLSVVSVSAATAWILALLAGSPYLIAALTAVWWIGYAVVFSAAQVLVVIGAPQWGALCAYTMINAAYLLVSLPYLVLTDVPTLTGLLVAAVSASWVAALVCLAIVFIFLGRSGDAAAINRSRDCTSSLTLPSVRELTASGFPLMLCRLCQAALPWIPVWALTVSGRPDWAAVYAAGARLTVAATAPIAALRFSMRPRIVLARKSLDMSQVATLSRTCSYLEIGTIVVILFVVVSGGPALIHFLLGGEYGGSAGVIVLLLFATLAEGFGGLSDEILKMFGKVAIVLLSLCVSVLAQVLLCILVVPMTQTLAWIALTTVAAFWIQYGIQVYALSHDGIRLWPILSSIRDNRRLKQVEL